jgi:hypothetical protein
MPRPLSGYLNATRHPWACLLFVLPLLAIYEVGLLLGPSSPESLRNGADSWLRGFLGEAGLVHLIWAPGLIVLILVAWALLRRHDRPDEYVPLWVGMAVESAVFAVGLWGFSRVLWPLVKGAAAQCLSAAPLLSGQNGAVPEPAVEQILSFIGAGVYEETLFRLLLFSALAWVFHVADFPGRIPEVLATLASALLFAAAHHLGPYGEAFDGPIFFFRTLAGFYFAVLFQLRGFGIAVGTHAGYDVLVGVVVIS